MTAATFRRLALALPDTVEGSHQNHADFRAGGKVFATLGYPDRLHGMIKLSATDQAGLIGAHPKAFAPASGAWGAAGSTLVSLSGASEATVKKALIQAHKGVWKDYPRPR